MAAPGVPNLEPASLRHRLLAVYDPTQEDGCQGGEKGLGIEAVYE